MVTIRAFDSEQATLAEWAAYHRFRRARAAEDDPGDPLQADADMEQTLRTPWPLREARRHFAWAGDEIIGLLGLSWRRAGTADAAAHAPYAWAWGGVSAARRRQGVATALLRPMLEFLDASGRRLVTIDTRQEDGHGFLRAIGAVEKNRMVDSRLPLAGLDWATLAGWEAAAADPAAGLSWETHAGRVPFDRLEALLPRFTELFADVPLGTLEVPPPRFEMPGYRAWYAEHERLGGAHLLVLLRQGEHVVAMCEVAWDARFPERAYQQLTSVDRAWRGRGTAKGIKAAMLRLVRETLPTVQLMLTSNAESNAPILAINRRLGFRPHRVCGSYQLSREALAAWLAGRAPA